MSGDKPTEEHHRDYSKEAASRIARCVNACDGVDDVILDALAKKDYNGKTVLRRLLDTVDMSGKRKAIKPG